MRLLKLYQEIQRWIKHGKTGGKDFELGVGTCLKSFLDKKKGKCILERKKYSQRLEYISITKVSILGSTSLKSKDKPDS